MLPWLHIYISYNINGNIHHLIRPTSWAFWGRTLMMVIFYRYSLHKTVTWSTTWRDLFNSQGFFLKDIWDPHACIPAGVFRERTLVLCSFTYYSDEPHSICIDLDLSLLSEILCMSFMSDLSTHMNRRSAIWNQSMTCLLITISPPTKLRVRLFMSEPTASIATCPVYLYLQHMKTTNIEKYKAPIVNSTPAR